MKVPIVFAGCLILLINACKSPEPLGEKLWYENPAEYERRLDLEPGQEISLQTVDF